MTEPVGLRINNYELTSLVGEGGMGAVYLAVHSVTGRKAAIKLLRKDLAQDKSLVTRFINEAKAATAIRHPNIIDVIDVGTLPPDKGDGLPYMMMEFLEGESLAQRLEKRGRLEVAEAVEVAIQTASALGAAHAKGIIHRDLKPDNLFLVPDEMTPGRERVKVLDFGIAKLRGEIGGGSVKTSAGSIMGTPPYMSPEQCRGIVEEVDHRTDVYALGIILYEMLCGAPPFLSPGYGEVLVMHLTQAPVAPRSKNPAIPEGLEATMLKSLAKRPEERFGSMAELQAALGRVPTAGNWRAVATPVEVAPTMMPTPPPRAAPPAPAAPSLTPKSTTFSATTGIIEGVERRGRGRAWLLAGGVAALVIAGGVAARSLLRPTVPTVHSGGVPIDPPRTVTPPPPPVVVPPAPEPAKVPEPAPAAEAEPVSPARRPARRPPARRGKNVAAEAVTATPVAPPPPATLSPPPAPPPVKKPVEKW